MARRCALQLRLKVFRRVGFMRRVEKEGRKVGLYFYRRNTPCPRRYSDFGGQDGLEKEALHCRRGEQYRVAAYKQVALFGDVDRVTRSHALWVSAFYIFREKKRGGVSAVRVAALLHAAGMVTSIDSTGRRYVRWKWEAEEHSLPGEMRGFRSVPVTSSLGHFFFQSKGEGALGVF